MTESIIEEKSFEFAIRIVRLYQYLCSDKREYVMSKQLLRSGTSVGANATEAQRGQSRADFHAKMNIALKEACEAHYWLRLLHRTDYISDKEFQSIVSQAEELIRILTAICKNTDKK